MNANYSKPTIESAIDSIFEIFFRVSTIVATSAAIYAMVRVIIISAN